MARLEERNETYFTTVRGMCRSCRQIVPARVFFRDGQVWQQSLCPTCAGGPVRIAADQAWYLEHVLRPHADHSPLPDARPPKRGCPHDCGPCTWHASPCQLPVFSVTNACNLRCPICFTYNREDQIWHMTPDEMRQTVQQVIAATGRVDLVNITGGEPTLHPEILELLSLCRRPEIGRITMNSNGIRLAEDAALCARLAELGVYVILSFNTFDPQASRRIHGQDLVATKLRAIDNLTRAGVRTTLLNVMIRDENEEACGRLLELLRTNDNILSLTVQTMTYTGQGGGSFPRKLHLPVDGAAAIVCRESGGLLRPDDFVTRPSAHPLCYQVSYMLKSGDTLLPFARFAPGREIERMIANSYLVHPGEDQQFFIDVINDLYARGLTGPLAAMRGLVERLYPPGVALSDFDRQKAAESAVRTVYVHAHMDEDTFDCSRAMLCPDLVPAGQGRMIPACTYNLFYRMQDERFYVDGNSRNS